MVTDAHVQTLLGVTAGIVDARAALAALAAGEKAVAYGAPVLPEAETWLRITALPTPGDAAGPLRAVLASAGGGLAEYCVVIQHTESGGLGLYISGGHPTLRDRLRAQLAPYADIEPCPAPAVRIAGVSALRYRLQPELARARSETVMSSGLLDRLGTITGNWTVVISLRSIHQVEIVQAQHAVSELAQLAGDNLTVTRQEAATRTTTTVSASWSRVQNWLDVLHAQLAQGGAAGMWKTAIWAMSADDWTAAQVVAALRGGVIEEQGRWFMAEDTKGARQGGPAPLSVLTTAEAAGMFEAPSASFPGLLVRAAPPAGRRPVATGKRINLGTYWGTELPATIGLTDLEGHAFVAGTTGAGKTTTLHRILAEAWNEHGVPFLVVDPVKDEYSEAAGAFRGGLQVLTGSELSMNLFATIPGEDPRRRVTQVAQAFRGAFTMPSPTPYVVTQLFDRLAMQPGGPQGTELFDLRDAVDGLVTSLGYAAEAQSNIRASLTTRLNVLLSPLRAHRFTWPDSSMVDAMFTRPTVVTLADLPDDEERSFVVLLLALATWARARARTNAKPVEHILVLEEAHRVMPELPASTDPESGSATAVSAALLTSMLAEVRSYGEQVIVVDQSPAKVASDVVRNTNLKIAHRIVAADDQQQMARALGIEDHRAPLLSGLARGQVVVSTRREPAPQTIAVEPALRKHSGARSTRVPRSEPGWPCCADSPEKHYRAWSAGSAVQATMAMVVISARVGAGDGAAVRAHSADRLKVLAGALGTRTDCLAWVGLRRLLVAERSAGLLPSAAAVVRQLDALFELWLSGSPVTATSAREADVPRQPTVARCPDCGTACMVREPAGVLASHGPRTGVLALGSTAWRTELTSVAEWTKSERERLAILIGEAGADTVVRCQVHQAVNRARLPDAVTDQILSRAGVPN